MLKKYFAAVLMLTCSASVVAAQAPRQPPAPARTWATAYVQMYNDMGSFSDPDSESRWLFGDNTFGFGGALHRVVGQSLIIGADVGYAKPSYERVELDDAELIVRGDARLLTAMATGRLAYGGGADLGFYLTGGAGVIAYSLSDIPEWNSDFALRAGTGLEYRFSANRGVFLEWGRIWGYHEKEGVTGGKAKHSTLQLGARAGF